MSLLFSQVRSWAITRLPELQEKTITNHKRFFEDGTEAVLYLVTEEPNHQPLHLSGRRASRYSTRIPMLNILQQVQSIAKSHPGYPCHACLQYPWDWCSMQTFLFSSL